MTTSNELSMTETQQAVWDAVCAETERTVAVHYPGVRWKVVNRGNGSVSLKLSSRLMEHEQQELLMEVDGRTIEWVDSAFEALIRKSGIVACGGTF